MPSNQNKPRKNSTNYFETPHENKTEATTKKNKADTLAETVSVNASLDNSNQRFLTLKNERRITKTQLQIQHFWKIQPTLYTERTKIHPKITQQQSAMMKLIMTFFEHQPKNSPNYLRKIFNIWINRRFPESWKIATAIPILERDNSIPANYCHIILTSCFCRSIERTIRKRLVRFLEFHNLINNSQWRFRKRIMWSN